MSLNIINSSMNMIFMIVSNVELLFKGGKSDGFFIVDGVVFDGFEFFCI